MLLKRLELQGFKSFADKTVLDFGDGSTAVVGPNGSGKSNISDAIRWVIGEMSAKTLRGSNMQDVIFAGTETRKAVNFAEVSIVLDNSTHMFDIDFDEVIITRRLFRSGESVYQINRVNCRLKDIHELFMDTGLGRDGYSVIGQGSVSQILSTKAEDRRSIFEEAAGVAKYKSRKEEAQRKLKGVEENLVRIGDITSELEAQRNPLKRQSEKARKYLTFYEEYKGLDVNLSLITVDKNRASISETEKLYESVNGELSELRKTEFDTEQKISTLYEESKAKDEAIAECNKKLIEGEANSMSVQNEISIAENDIKNNHSIIVRIDDEIASIREKNAEREESIEKYTNEIKEKEAAAAEILNEFDVMREEQDKISEDREALSSKIEELKSDAVEKLNAISSEKARMNGIEALRGSFIERREVVETEIKSFKEGISNTKQDIEKCRAEIDEKSQKLTKMQDTLARHTENFEKIKTENEETIKVLNNINVEYNSKSSKKKILEGMENDYAGYAKSVKAVLKADELKGLSIYGTVSGLVDVKKEYVVAIETALGGALQNIVVENEEDAKEAISYLRKTNSGRATFLPISSVKGRTLDNVRDIASQQGFLGIADELVNYDKKYDGIFKNLLGRVVVADNIDNAISMSRKFGYKFRIVTLEGDLFNIGGSMSGGSVNKQSGFLSRAAEIKTLSAEIKELFSKIREYTEKRQKAENDMRIIENQISSYIPLIREYEDEILRLENTQKHLSDSLDSGSDTERNYASELEQIENQLSESSGEIAALLQSIRNLENQSQQLQDETERLTEEYNKMSEEKELRSQSIMDKTMMLASMEKDIKIINETIEGAKDDIISGNDEIASKERDKEALNIRNDELYKEITTKRRMLAGSSDATESIKKQISDIEEEKKRIVEILQDIQNSNKDLTDRLLNLQQELSRLENRKDKLEGDIDAIISRLWEDYELTYSNASEIKKEVENEKEAFARLSELKNQIKSLGSVNIDAIEEYKSVEERFNFLSTQKKDLDKSKSDLEEIIASMEDLMQEHFDKQFKEINESFGLVFKELFGGGRGRLYLSDPDNILESGIEIEVQLPGKGLQNLNLYSGGEKSFIAIALLFAILRVKPAPFCILDEIDAALDDVNVSRFATYLKNYVDRTQFIVITHRRGTMEAANILYGVTMQEKGVSKLLSLHIDDVDEELVG